MAGAERQPWASPLYVNYTVRNTPPLSLLFTHDLDAFQLPHGTSSFQKRGVAL